MGTVLFLWIAFQEGGVVAFYFVVVRVLDGGVVFMSRPLDCNWCTARAALERLFPGPEAVGA